MSSVDVAVLVLRVVLGGTMVAHGYNHLLGPGGLDGTSRWFASMGLRPPRVHAILSGVGEMAAGGALLAGLLTPLSAAFVIGTMVVAGVTVHRRNGYFVFREGYEYVLVLGVVSAVIGLLGGGRASLDHVLGWTDVLSGAVGMSVAVGCGVVCAAGLLMTCWQRPETREPSD